MPCGSDSSSRDTYSAPKSITGHFHVDSVEMPTAKRARAAGSAKPALEAVSVSSPADLGTGLVTLNIFDGTRQKIKHGTKILLTIHDGAQNQLFRSEVVGPSVALRLPVHN